MGRRRGGAATIDRINIYQASRMAMRMAVSRLNPAPDFLLVDAVPLDAVPQRALIKGDARCHAIAAASILAKVQRDACMLAGTRSSRVRTGLAQGLCDAGTHARSNNTGRPPAPPELRTRTRAFTFSAGPRRGMELLMRGSGMMPPDPQRPAAAETVVAPASGTAAALSLGTPRCQRSCLSRSAWRWACFC